VALDVVYLKLCDRVQPCPCWYRERLYESAHLLRIDQRRVVDDERKDRVRRLLYVRRRIEPRYLLECNIDQRRIRLSVSHDADLVSVNLDRKSTRLNSSH